MTIIGLLDDPKIYATWKGQVTHFSRARLKRALRMRPSLNHRTRRRRNNWLYALLLRHQGRA